MFIVVHQQFAPESVPIPRIITETSRLVALGPQMTPAQSDRSPGSRNRKK